MGGRGGIIQNSFLLLNNFYSMVCTHNKIFKIDRDRALEIMWYADSIYDEI